MDLDVARTVHICLDVSGTIANSCSRTCVYVVTLWELVEGISQTHPNQISTLPFIIAFGFASQ